MPNIRVIEKEYFALNGIDTSSWSTVLIDNIPLENQHIFLKRKRAVELYIENKLPVSYISEETGIIEKEIRRLVKRCLTLNEDGEPWGFAALIPNKRIKSYERKSDINNSSANLTGAFSMFLDKHEKIKEKIISLYLNKDKKNVHEPIMSPKIIHKKFIQFCHNENIQENEYPFNTKDLARRSLQRYLKKLDSDFYSITAKRRGSDIQRHANSTGIGDTSNPSTVRPFQRVQFDGHKIDGVLAIVFKTPEGDEVVKIIDRVWLLVIIDVATRVILGHYITLNKEYSSYDVLQCIKRAIIPKQKMNFSIPGLKYPNGIGYHSLAIANSRWALWDEFYYDNAKANLSELVRNRLTQIIGSSVNAGPVNMPERRSLVERFFGILEENGFHRLPNTTGNNPNDPRRKNPEKNAVKYKISSEHLEEITEVLIANYNLTAHQGIYGFAPLELMQQRIERGLLPRVMPSQEQNDIIFLSLKETRTIRGSKEKGRRPYICFQGVEYRNDVLSRSPDLIGTKLDLLINPDDLRVIRAYFNDGSELGLLTATGKWGIRAHTLQQRNHINKLISSKVINITQMDDPIEIYQRYLTESASKQKRDRNRLADMQRTQNREYASNNFIVSGTDTKENGTSNVKVISVHQNMDVNDEKKKRIEELKKSKAFKTYNF